MIEKINYFPLWSNPNNCLIGCKDNLFIYVCIYTKYDNLILPRLAEQITGYLLVNPEKIGYYLNPNIHVGMILQHLARVFAKDMSVNPFEEVIKFVEGK